jgi:hypothetical protein
MYTHDACAQHAYSSSTYNPQERARGSTSERVERTFLIDAEDSTSTYASKLLHTRYCEYHIRILIRMSM